MNHTSFQQTRKEAFSLIEIMVTVSLLALIILALVQAFNVTQKAVVTGLVQTDVLATGRMVGEMLAREIEQESLVPGSTNLSFWGTNFQTNVWPTPLGDTHTNVLGAVLFYVSNRDRSRLVGYSPLVDSNGVGVLTRYEGTNTNAVADGVVGFTVQPLMRNGSPATNVDWSKTLPGGMQVELTLLENRTLEQYRGMSNNVASAKEFLTNQAAHLHIFRQRISIKAAQP